MTAMMNTLLGLLSAALLSASALVVVLVRMSPLLDPAYALPFFFLTLFFSLGMVAATMLVAFHAFVFKTGAKGVLRPSLRRGFLFAAASCIIVFLHLLQVLTWWIAGLVYLVLVLVEVAVEER
jgi:hypothetical protein